MGIWALAGVSFGVAIGALGLWLLRWGKRGSDGSVSPPTRLTLGVVCLMVGYHLVGWSVPSVWFVVPPDLWWVVVLGAGLAIAGAFAVDALEGGG